MKTLSLAAFALSALALVGCASTTKQPATPPSMPVTGEALTAMREAFNRVDPEARLASVTEVLPSGGYLRLGEAAQGDFPMNAAVAIVDAMRQTIGYGEVVKSDETGVDVRFESSGSRAPAVGDVVVRFGTPQ